MINHRRGWSTITVDILETSIKPSNKMRIMYKSNLNFVRLNKYLSDLTSKGFLEKMADSNGRYLYKTSAKGKVLLETLRKAEDLISDKT